MELLVSNPIAHHENDPVRSIIRATSTHANSRAVKAQFAFAAAAGIFFSATGANFYAANASEWAPYLNRLGVQVAADSQKDSLVEPIGLEAPGELLSFITATLGLSHVQLADLFGVSRQTLNHWVRGTRNITAENSAKLLMLHATAKALSDKRIQNIRFLLGAKILGGKSILERFKSQTLDLAQVAQIATYAIRASEKQSQLKISSRTQHGDDRSLDEIVGVSKVFWVGDSNINA